MKYRPEIDGLRAIAVVPVLLFHAGFSTFAGGFVGVDVFFVISGYLITTILLREMESGQFSLVGFYERRARRILPALMFVVAACIPVAWFLMTPSEAKSFAQSILAVTFFVSNINFWLESGYFEIASEYKPLLHTWSLAVEEQFYLVFPLFLLLVWPRHKKLLVPLMVVAALASLALCEWGWRNAPSATFFLAPTRGWELLAGSLCAMAARRGVVGRDWLAAPGLAMILASIVLFDHATPFPSLYALLPVGGTALVILFASQATVTCRLLATPGLVGLGLLSYSAYLWHQPLFAFARMASNAEPSASIFSGLIVLTFGLAYLSWRYVEGPFRHTSRAGSLSQRAIFASAAFGSAMLVGVGVWGHVTDGWRATHYARLSDAEAKMLSLIEEVDAEHKANAALRFDNGDCVFDVRGLNDDVRDRISECAERHGPGVLILGDSHAIDLYGAVALTSHGEHPFIVGVTSGGCRPHSPNAECPYQAIVDFAGGHPDVFRFAIYQQAGFYLLRGEGFDVGSRRMFATLSPDEDTPPFEPNVEYVEAVRHYLERLAEHVPVVWLSPRIEPHLPAKYVRRAGCEHSYQLRPGTIDVFMDLEDYISENIDDSPVFFLSQNNLLNLSFPEDFLNCDDLFWSDGDHFSDAGEVRFGRRMRLLENAASVIASERRGG